MSTREMLYQDIAFLTDEQVEELAVIVKELRKRKKANDDIADEVDALCGIFHDAANPDLIPLEKEAWASAAAEKHLRILEEMKHENS